MAQGGILAQDGWSWEIDPCTLVRQVLLDLEEKGVSLVTTRQCE